MTVTVIFEGGAIALYLTDKFPAAKMGPLPGALKRGDYLSWLFYRPGVMEPAFMERRMGFSTSSARWAGARQKKWNR